MASELRCKPLGELGDPMGSADTIRRHSLIRLRENLRMLVGGPEDRETGLGK
jgi:hypothetical protein